MSALSLQNAAGERIDHAYASCGRPAPVVVIGHGVTSSHDRPYLAALSAGLAAAGLDSLRISFSGNGSSEGRFEKCTVTKEVADLGSVLDALAGREIAYAGHSLGAAVGVLRAARDARIRALVSLAGIVRVRAFVERQFGHLVPGCDAMLGRERCPLSQAFLDDAREVDTVLPAARRVAVPWLLVHGTADELVPVDDSRDARAASGGRAELVELPGVDHRFTGAIEALVEAAVPWLARRLLERQ